MTDTPNSSTDNACIRSQNNKVLLATAISLIIGVTGGYYINEHKLLAKPGEASGGAASDEQIETVVKRVIADNPQLLMDSLQSLQRKNAEKQAEMAKGGLKKYQDELKNDENTPFVGPKDAAISVIQFYDYHCGYCKKAAPVIRKLVDNHKEVKVIFKEFPILSPDSRSAARAALAVSKLDSAKYYEFHQLLMENQGGYSDDKLKDLAEKVGIKGDALLKEMKEDWIEAELKKVGELAGKLGIQGTPAIIVGDELIPGYMEYDALDAKVKALKK